VLAALDAGLGELEASRRAARSTLRVGLATTAVVPLVGETLRRFAEERPDVHLAVSNHGMIDPSAGLRAGTVDVGFVRPPFTDDGVVAMETVLTEPRYIVLREGHPLAERESLRPHDVVGEPWIYVEGADPKTRAFWSLEEFRDEPLRTGARVNSFEEAFAAVLAGLAVTCQGESAIRTVGAAFPQLRPVPLEGVEPARVAVAWRNREEVFIVEAGAVTFWIDGSELAAAPETTVYMPRGVPHTFRVDSDGAVMLGVMTPGHFESLFRELGVPAQERTLPPAGAAPFDVARVMAAQEERGTRVVGPPLAPLDA
jgi:DNA-binding transcriptional LysR family regulator